MIIRKGQLGINRKNQDNQERLKDEFGNSTIQRLGSYYQNFKTMMKQGVLNFKYRENELKANVQRNLTHLMRGYEMYNWQIFQSLKVT